MPNQPNQPNRLPLPLVALATLILSAPGSASATTWNVPGDSATIQGGIDLAGAADTVLVAPGTYSGGGNTNLNFGGVDLVLRSSGGSTTTIIDCGNTARGFLFNSGETAAARVEGFTIQSGNATNGGGAFLENASPMFRDCRFVHCFASDAGGALEMRDPSFPTFLDCEFDGNFTIGTFRSGGAINMFDGAVFTGCEFRNNSAGGIGGAIRILGGSIITIADCDFLDNVGAGGGAFINQSSDSIFVYDCEFRGNESTQSGGAVFTSGSWTRYERCLFDDNEAAPGFVGGAIGVLLGVVEMQECTVARSVCDSTQAALHVTNNGSKIFLERSIVYGTIGGAAVKCQNFGDVVATCSNLFGNDGGDWDAFCGTENTIDGNFSADPLFCDETTGDFRLASGSPCLSAPGCGQVGAFGPCGAVTDAPMMAGLPAVGLALQAAPNPFRAHTTLAFELSATARGAEAQLSVIDVTGRLVSVLSEGRVAPSERRQVTWDGRDASGRPLPNGVYFVRLRAGAASVVKRVVLLR